MTVSPLTAYREWTDGCATLYQGDTILDIDSVLWYYSTMPDAMGRFQKGEHWRQPKPHWDKTWLEAEYIGKGRSAQAIANEEGCTENNILFWLIKFGIPRRTMKQIRQAKRWGAVGSANPSWRGGTSSERQNVWNSLDWAWAIRQVYARDKRACQRCHRKQRGRKGFHIHHRIGFAQKDLRTNLDNLVLLCPRCHHWVHSKRNTHKEFTGSFQATMALEKGG